MEVSEANLVALANYLQQTLLPDAATRKTAEKFLETIEGNQNYPLLLLHLVDKTDLAMTVKIAGAITFKNYVKRNWKVEEDAPDKIHAADRLAIKQLIVTLMLKSPASVQKQLSDAITIIGQEDFPDKWPELLKEMVEKFSSGDFNIINGALRTGHSIFKRYRHMFKSNELWTEIKFVLDNFAQPLTDLFVATMGLVEQHSGNVAALKVLYSSLTLIGKIFYSLNSQDLPEFFEDNMSVWMGHFHTLLITDNPLLKTEDDEETGILEQLKSVVCESVGLYASKYDEEFAPFVPQFVTDVWNLLVATGPEVKYDILVSNAIGFLSSVADRASYKNLFEDPSVLGSICEKVILPNMEFRTSDEELFEDNPEEYIRRDIEGSDVDTRRRAASDLVRSLSKFFEAQMTEIFGRYIQAMLVQYAENPTAHWRRKDAAIYLVMALASKGQTARHGATQTNQLVSLQDFFLSHIKPELEDINVNERLVLKADALKYLITFRSQLPPEILRGSLGLLVPMVCSRSHVVHSYAANALDKLLVLRGSDNAAVINTTDFTGFEERLLTNLFAVLTMPGSEENEYVMKAVMRFFSALQERVLPYLPAVLPVLTAKLRQVAKNPSKPHFNHYLFETISLAIRIVCKQTAAAVSSFEEALFPVFQDVFQQDVQEFMPYAFQILSLLLEMHTAESSVPDPYMALFPHLLSPLLWERPANIHPLVRLLQAFIRIGAQQVVTANKLGALLGIFQKLVASKSNDHEGFYLLESMVEHLPKDAMAPYVKQVWVLLFQRLSSSKTTKFIKNFLVFINLFVITYGVAQTIQLVDTIQPKLFGMVVERLVILEVQKVSGQIERKICAVGLTKILCEDGYLLKSDYVNFWAPVLQALIGLFELPEDASVPDDEHFIEIEDTPGYQASYAQLVFVGKAQRDPVASVTEPRSYLVQNLHKLSVAHPGQLGPLIGSGLAPEAQNYVQKYLQANNLALA